jgi:microcystin degradation protein MlrC
MTISQTLGPDALMQYINADEAIKRLAASQGIDVLNLVKSMEQIQQEQDDAAQQQEDQLMMQQAGQLLKAPIADPSKNPMAGDTINAALGEEVVPPMQ